MRQVKVNEFVEKIMYDGDIKALMIGERIYNCYKISILPVLTLEDDCENVFKVVVPEKLQ